MYRNLPISLDLRITQKCNLNCSFCFGTLCTEEISLHDWIALLKKFWKHGVRVINITGGEPTLHDNLNQILSAAKKIGFKIALSTNGILLDKISADCLNCVDFFSIPIDGEDYDTCHQMRGIEKDDYEKVHRLIRSFKTQYPSKKIKVGTVITMKNINKIQGIYTLVSDYADIWKLYQVSKHLKNENIYDELAVSDYEFEKIYNKLLTGNSKDNFYIEAYRNNERAGKSFFCEPNADAMIIYNGKEIIIGNFIKDFDDILLKWQNFINTDLMEKNIKYIFI